MLGIEEYEALRRRPAGRPAMIQHWRDLLFLHRSMAPAEVQKLLPSELTVDTYEGKAWVGLVPFRMHGIRPANLPALPWLSAFPETNVRTYVHLNGHQPAVWFFSLDAARWVACQIAKAGFGLPYLHARMRTARTGDHVRYESKRLEAPAAKVSIEASLGEALKVEPDSLDFFLVERYLLYARRSGKLVTGQVHHTPYQLRQARVETCSEGLLSTQGIQAGEWEHVCFSEGVDVEVFAPQRV